jgi:uncharacterized membrane protein
VIARTEPLAWEKTMRFDPPSPEDFADIRHHWATFPAALWAATLVIACVLSLVEITTEHMTSATPTAVAVAPETASR